MTPAEQNVLLTYMTGFLVMLEDGYICHVILVRQNDWIIQLERFQVDPQLSEYPSGPTMDEVCVYDQLSSSSSARELLDA